MTSYRRLPFSLVLEPEPDARSVPTMLSSSDPWTVLAGCVASAKAGRLQELERIPNLMRETREAAFWDAASELLGLAAPWDLQRNVLAGFLPEKDRFGVQYYMTTMLSYGCGLWAVDPMLKLYEVADSNEARSHIAQRLSLLLEPEPGPVSDGAPTEDDYLDLPGGDVEMVLVHDYADYRATAGLARSKLNSVLRADADAVFQGAALDVATVAASIRRRFHVGLKGSARNYPALRILEAMTGVSARDVLLEDGTLHDLAAIALVESASDLKIVDSFKPGRRYFFGTEVPE